MEAEEREQQEEVEDENIAAEDVEHSNQRAGELRRPEHRDRAADDHDGNPDSQRPVPFEPEEHAQAIGRVPHGREEQGQDGQGDDDGKNSLHPVTASWRARSWCPCCLGDCRGGAIRRAVVAVLMCVVTTSYLPSRERARLTSGHGPMPSAALDADSTWLTQWAQDVKYDE